MRGLNSASLKMILLVVLLGGCVINDPTVLLKVFGKPYWRQAEWELNSPCFVKACEWVKEQTDAGKEVGYVTFIRDLSHWEKYVSREDRYHVVGTFKEDGVIKFWECSYPPLGIVELSPAELASVDMWAGINPDKP